MEVRGEGGGRKASGTMQPAKQNPGRGGGGKWWVVVVWWWWWSDWLVAAGSYEWLEINNH